MNRSRLLVASAATVLLLAGCGGSRPSVDDLERAILSGESGIGVPDDQARCTAEVLESSKLSDEMLISYIANGDHEMSDDERAEFRVVLDRLDVECGFEQGAG